MNKSDNSTNETHATDRQEIEWQFDALDLHLVERWLRDRPPDASISIRPAAFNDIADTYFDTDDWRFYHAGYALRLRTKNGRAEATLKAVERLPGALQKRREITQALDEGTFEHMFNIDGAVSERVHLIAGTHPIRPSVEIHTRRHTFALALDGVEIGEITLDHTIYPREDGTEPARLQRVEIEVATETEQLNAFIEALRTECNLQASTIGKYELGLRIRGLENIGTRDLGSTIINETSTIGEAVYAALRRQFSAFLHHEPGTRLGEDPEELHDMRVASRRMRATMRTFAQMLPKRAERIEKELKWIAGELGAVRDLDVQIEQFTQWQNITAEIDRDALQIVIDLLAHRRVAARKRMLTTLESRRYERLIAACTSVLLAGAPRRASAARLHVLIVAPDVIAGRYRKVSKAAKPLETSSPAKDYHRLRIRCKRLRYTLELFVDLYGKPAQEFIQLMKALQDVLGQYQDAIVAGTHLRELTNSQGRKLPPQTIFALGAIAQRYEQQAADRRSQFPKAFRKVSGKAWTRLAREMENQRHQNLTGK